MSDIGVNFRSTSGYVTDGANETYCLGDIYPTTRGGVTFGWISGHATGVNRDRNSGNDRRLAGFNGTGNSGTQAQFQLDLPASGSWTIHLALGDASYAQGYEYVRIKDGSGGSALLTIDDTDGTSANHFDDAGGNDRTAAAWPGSEVGVSVTFSGSTLWLLLGSPVAQAGQSTLAHLRAVQAGGGGTTYTLAVSDKIGGQEGGLSRLASYFRQPADNLGGSDTFTRKAPAFRVYADNLGLTDTFARLASSYRVAVDNLGESDAASRLAACYRVPSDSLGLTDTAVRKAASFRAASDSLGLSDTAARLAASFRLVTDNLGVHDAAFIGGAVRLIAVLDSIGLRDSVARTAAALRVLVDAAGFADAMQRAAASLRSLADAAGMQDAAARSAACYRVTVDTLGLHDAALMSGTVIISLPIARFAADYGYQVNVGADYPFLVSVAEDVPG